MHSDLVDTPSGYQIPMSWYLAPGARGNVILMAALGVAAGFYTPLAEALCERGLNVALIEQRGHGDSAWRASREVDFGFREALDEDLPAAMAWVDEKAPGIPLYLSGHSLGGHYSAITAGRFPDQVAGIAIIACASPWVGGFSGITRLRLRFLCRLIPLLCRLLGYYPGSRVGFGGREARTLMADWLTLARTNTYRANGLHEDLEQGIRRYPGPVLSLLLADDAYAPPAAVAAVTDKFVAAAVSEHVITAAELGDSADHFRWARSPRAVAELIQSWVRR